MQILKVEHFKKHQDIYFLGLLFFMALGRVLANQSIGCPQDFDCNSYIRMVHDFTPSPDVPGHHAMRIFPIFLVRWLLYFNISIEQAFQVVSGASYISFALLSYCFIRQVQGRPLYAFSWSLLLLSLHHAMRIPLYLVYQANDALVYPIGLGLIWATFRKKEHWVFPLAMLGAFTRQNLFVLGFLSLAYLAKTQKSYKAVLSMGILVVSYILLQNYYHAQGVFKELLSPPSSFFSFTGQLDILKHSEFLDLWVALLPLLIFSLKPLIVFFKDHWHWFLYAAITIGQPYIGFHLTGNNLPRLALQGLWVIALGVALSSPLKQNKSFDYGLLFYAIAIYTTWGITQRWWMACAMLIYLAVWKFCWPHVTALRRTQ